MIDAKFIRILKQFAPFGPENMLPVFLTKNLTDKGYVKVVGTNHLKFDPVQKGNQQAFPAIAFSLGEHFDALLQRKEFEMCYTIDENEWNGNVKVQLNVKDIRF